jgi:hypothetical protein
VEIFWLVTILPVILHGCETWSLTLRGVYRYRVLECRVLRRTFGLKSDEVTGVAEKYIMRIFITCNLHLVWARKEDECGQR